MVETAIIQRRSQRTTTKGRNTPDNRISNKGVQRNYSCTKGVTKAWAGYIQTCHYHIELLLCSSSI